MTTQKNAADLLSDMADTYRERNAIYGDSYKTFGAVMKGLFPNGLLITKEDEFNRLALMTLCVSKMQRYAAQFKVGGHQDSAHDLAVYAAMLEELTHK
jgi:hypothetical protein